jgi:hypothetical protein
MKKIRLKEKDLQRIVKRTIKESSDKDYEKEMDHIETQLKKEFVELMGYIVYEYENVTKDDIIYAADNDGIFEELKDYFEAVKDLEDWAEDNDYGGELMEEVREVVDMLNSFFPYHIEVKKDPKIEELLSKYESWRYK